MANKEKNPAITPRTAARLTAEEQRLEESRQRKVHWKRWGPYLSERQWGTVREDYSPYGNAWDSFPHDHARSRTYRWGEDGLGGLSDKRGHVCFALALWNGRDPILKERLFGLTGTEGNHGEDVKEYYFYLDSTPTHSYMKYLYKYPQAAFPYARLVQENRRDGKREGEFELLDTGVFDESRYFDVFVEYAKSTAEDILIRINAHNRGPETATVHLLPHLWFRNTWSWGASQSPSMATGDRKKPSLKAVAGRDDAGVIEADHWYTGKRWLVCEGAPSASRSSVRDAPELLFTENESNFERLWNAPNRTPYVKDGINDYVVHNQTNAVNPAKTGTKSAAYYKLEIAPGASATVRLRFTNQAPSAQALGTQFDAIFTQRLAEAGQFYARLTGKASSDDAKIVQRQAFAGMLWSKQFFHYDVKAWLNGDPAGPPPPVERKRGRNSAWQHFYNADIISMPDKWEFPWYAAWDLAFHCIPLAMVDPDFAKEQLILMLREWYMHPNGQIPAYEWAFGDVNPPVHAWAAWRVYKIEKRMTGTADRDFLQKVFHKLLLNFTWWVNRKDAQGNNVFEGGFLGLDNIGVFDRSAPLPTGGFIEQSDGTSWMGMYCLNMLAIALELANQDPAYEDVASKFFEHFVYIAHATHHCGGGEHSLWDPEDGFYYDVLALPNGQRHFLKVRSMVGLIPLYAVETLEPEILNKLEGFRRRMNWFIENRPEFREHVDMQETPQGTRILLSIVGRQQLPSVLRYMLDENEFLGPHGIRALSRYHRDHPYILQVNGHQHRVDYEPAESSTGLFGGNSNWRGPVWFPVNYLLIESLQKFDYYLGKNLQVQFPAGSGQQKPLWDVAAEISRRLVRTFLRCGAPGDGCRPVYGKREKFQRDPHWRDLIQFHEYFHGDTGAGVGASHQTGWTGLVAKLIEQSGE